MGLVMLDWNTDHRDTGAWSRCLWDCDGYWKVKRRQLTGIDQIPTELIKAGGRTIRSDVCKLINSIWNKEELRVEWKELIIVTIFNKGDKTECSSYRGISLLSSTYTILSNILVSRLTPHAEEIIGDHQCGFWHNRSITDDI